MASGRLSMKAQATAEPCGVILPREQRATTDHGRPHDKIPADVARELRALAHDLSNALETIVQATYLISQASPPENLRRWVELMDQASKDAVKINNKLREIMRTHS